MATVKRIVCLANSFKIGGNCIAGREVLGNRSYGPWIRPVGTSPTAEVTFDEYKYENNAIPKLLDIIDIPVSKPTPRNHQTENWLIDPRYWWAKVGELQWDELERLREHPSSLWINSDSTTTGVFNCISQSEAATLTHSLVLIKTKTFIVEVGSKTWEGRTSKTYRGNFMYKGTYYSLNVTDPVVTNLFASKEPGNYELTNIYLSISLTEPWDKDNHRCHKLVAAVISPLPL